MSEPTISRKPAPFRAPRGNPWIARGAGLAAILAAAAMLVALFQPFVSQICTGCSATIAAAFPSPSGTLVLSPDAGALIWIAALVAVTAVGYLIGVGGRWTAGINGLLSLAALALAIFEGVEAFPRVLGAEELPLGMTSVSVSHMLDLGYYLFLGGAALAVLAAATMLLVRRGVGLVVSPRALGTARLAAAAGWACLAALAVAFAGVFLPFAQLACGFGCPDGVSKPGSWSAALIGGPGGWAALALLAGATVATALWLVRRTRTSGWPLATLVLSLALLALVNLEVANAGRWVLAWPFSIRTAPVQGFGLLQGGSSAALLLAILMVTCVHRQEAPSARIAAAESVAVHAT
jgi:hypothetical protein